MSLSPGKAPWQVGFFLDPSHPALFWPLQQILKLFLQPSTLVEVLLGWSSPRLNLAPRRSPVELGGLGEPACHRTPVVSL